MKLQNILCACAVAAFLLSSCNGSDKSDSIRPIGDYKDATAADSLIYYFGQLRAVEYWQIAQQDTIMKSRDKRDEFLQGLKAGLDATKESDAYNQGLYVGIQLAMNMKEFEEDYNCKINRKILVNAVTDGLKNDSAVNIGEANQNFREILENLNRQKDEADKKSAIENLAKDAKTQKWVKISDTLYAGKAEGATPGAPKLKDGQTVRAQIEIATLEGRVIDIRPDEALTVGVNYPGPVTEAVKTMSEKEMRTFYTTAPAIMGRYYERYNLKPTQIMKLTVKLGGLTTPETENTESQD